MVARGLQARPHPNNILEFHFVVRGPVDTPFEGGYYYGVLYLPNEYPMKPPDIVLLTPSGRFQPGAKICMSITAFHQESWNPAWGKYRFSSLSAHLDKHELFM